MKRKWIAAMCAFTVLAGTMAGCGAATETTGKTAETDSKTSKTEEKTTGGEQASGETAGDKVEIKIGALNFQSSSDREVWPTTVVEELEKKLGVTMTIVGYDEERLNLDLASGQLCDIMMIYPKHLDGVLKGGHALALDPYLDNIASNIGSEKMNLRNEVMRKYRSNDTGNLFFVTPAVADEGIGEGGPTLGLGYGVRWDLYKEIGAPEINNGDDYIDAMIKMKELYPQTEDGLPVYITSAYNDLGTHAWTMRGLLDKGYATLDGNSMYTVNVSTKENPLSHNVFSESTETPFWTDMKFYNRMYKEGLLDPDCFITKGEDMVDKYSKGQYLGSITPWHYGKWNDAMKAQDPETTKGFIILPSYMGWTNAVYQGGWADKMFFVASASPNAEKAVEVLDYLSSKEFARLEESGVEGVNWTVNADGIPELTEDVIDMKSNPARIEEWKKLGLGTMQDMMGNANNSVLEDGYPASLWNTTEIWSQTLSSTEKDYSEFMGIDYPSQVLQKRIEEGKSIDQRDFNTLATICMPTAPKDITRIDNNCVELVINALPSIIQAQTEEEFNSAKETLISDLKNADVETAITWWNTNWETAKQAVEEMKK